MWWVQPCKKRQEPIHEPLERAEGCLPLSQIHLGADSRRIVDPRLLTALEHPPAFLKRSHRIPENMKHSGTDDPIEGFCLESQASRVPRLKMNPCGASGPVSIALGDADENTAQINPDDPDMRRSLHDFNGQITRACPKVKEKAVMKSGNDFLGHLTVIRPDDESGGLFIEGSQGARNPFDR
jgi:hypothetical protein